MRTGFRYWVIASIVMCIGLLQVEAQTPAYRAPRTADGKPDLNGIWQALNEADWELQGHAASQGPVSALGAVFSIPPSLGVVDGNEIPYLPAPAAKKKRDHAN